LLALAAVVVLFLILVMMNEWLRRDGDASSAATATPVAQSSDQAAVPAPILVPSVSEAEPDTSSVPGTKAVIELQIQTDKVDFNYLPEVPAEEINAAASPIADQHNPEVSEGEQATTPEINLTGATPTGNPQSEMPRSGQEELQMRPVAKQQVEVQPTRPPSVTKPVVRTGQSADWHEWLSSRNPEHYTLQLLGVRDEAAAKAFVEQYANLNQLAYFRTLYKGKDWFVVIQGDFSSREAAMSSVAAMPPALRNAKPWPRQLDQIQQEVAGYQ
jgi:DamX protein